MKLEVCCTHPDSALIARDNGADRIELCMHLGSGGFTPSHSLMQATLRAIDIPVFVLIRPREGSFTYSATEKTLALDDVKHALDLGAHGIVTGALNDDGQPDLAFMAEILALTGGCPVTFHRAFDEAIKPVSSAVALHQLGVHRILTSGQALTADQGMEVFKALLKLEQCPIILAGGGVTPENAPLLLNAGISELHFSARKSVLGKVGRGIFDPTYEMVDGALVSKMRAAIDQHRSRVAPSVR